MPSVPHVDVALPNVQQVGIVVEDIEDSMERYRAILGIEPWTGYRFEPPALSETTYRGEPVEYGMRLAHGYAGEMDIELIEPLFGPTIYTDHLDNHGEGLHHIKSSWPGDPERTYRVVAAFEDAGIAVIQSGCYHDSEFWYFDTAPLLNGLVFETSIRRNVADRTPDFEYPP